MGQSQTGQLGALQGGMQGDMTAPTNIGSTGGMIGGFNPVTGTGTVRPPPGTATLEMQGPSSLPSYAQPGGNVGAIPPVAPEGMSRPMPQPGQIGGDIWGGAGGGIGYGDSTMDPTQITKQIEAKKMMPGGGGGYNPTPGFGPGGGGFTQPVGQPGGNVGVTRPPRQILNDLTGMYENVPQPTMRPPQKPGMGIEQRPGQFGPPQRPGGFQPTAKPATMRPPQPSKAPAQPTVQTARQSQGSFDPEGYGAPAARAGASKAKKYGRMGGR